jgi:sigma-E factor negative regulatory protein RseA
MNDASKLQLSALLDAELGGDETRFLLRRIEAEPDLAALWSRYHLARECLRRQNPAPLSVDFSQRVMRRLPAAHGAGRWLRMGVGGAIAASVAVAALVLVQPRQQGVPDGASPTLAAAPSAAPQRAVASPSPDYSLLLGGSPSPFLDVEPASAVISPGGYFTAQPVGYTRLRPVWMQNAPPPPLFDASTFPHTYSITHRDSAAPADAPAQSRVPVQP